MKKLVQSELAAEILKYVEFYPEKLEDYGNVLTEKETVEFRKILNKTVDALLKKLNQE